MRSACRRVAATLVSMVAISATASIGLGCAGMDGDVFQVLTQPDGSASERSTARAYDLGYQDGRRDVDRDRRPDYTRHRDDYDWSTERAFASGYRDGYEQEPRRYTSTDWDDQDGGRSYGVVRAVPEWLIGGFRGWNELYGVDVGLTVYPNASVVLVAGRTTRQGVYRDGQVVLRQSGTYAVSRARGGIRFTKVDDARNTVYLRRTD